MNDSQHATGFDAESWRRRLRVAQGLEPAELVIAGGSVVNVFGGDLLRADVAIAGGRIAGIGTYPDGVSRIDAAGMVVAPSFIDAHIHLESTLIWPAEFASAV